MRIVYKYVGNHTAYLFRSSIFEYVIWHFVPPQDRKRGRVPKFGVLYKVRPVFRSNLSPFTVNKIVA